MIAERFGVLGNPGTRRVLGFAAAFRSQGFPEPFVIPWQQWLQPEFDRCAALKNVDVLRLETPAEDLQVERLILLRGLRKMLATGVPPSLDEEGCRSLAEDEGELRHQRQWYAGWCDLLEEVEVHCRQAKVRTMNPPRDIAAMFDKAQTREILLRHDVPVAEAGGRCVSFDDLIAIMELRNWNRVFLKPLHASSAAGVMAIARGTGDRWQATTSATLKEREGSPGIFNSKQLLKITDAGLIRATVNAVCREEALVERWFPKASLEGRSFDLRVVVIAGQTAQIAVRTSAHPITNLHLRNRRGELEKVKTSLGEERWQSAVEIAAAAGNAFPDSHYCGVDLMIGPAGRKFAIAEVNAFGDLLHRELWRGLNPWEAELALWPGKINPAG